jgi:putative heme-binding domain-containing protein
LKRILDNVVNPSLETREGFEQQIVITTDGRVLSGLIVDQDNQVVVFKDGEGETHIVPRDEVDELVKSRQSLMPESTLADLTDQELRDLFAYLRSSQPLP